MAPPTLPVTLADIEAARELLADVIRPTPLEFSRALSARVGGDVHLKLENLQRAGSFKIRGAYTRICRLSPQERARGVVAASAGNHAQGVALAAQLLGIHATVYMPAGAPIPKVQATRGYGAAVVFHGHSVDDCLVAAREHAARTGAVLIHPFDHVDVVAGQGTCGLEILEQCPALRTVLVCTGGGGLLAGVAAAVKATRPHVRVVGVQAASAAAYPPSLALGRPVPLDQMRTMADGIAVGCPGEVPFELVRALVDDVVTVDEDLLARALLFLLERAKQVAEPAGAAAVAALLDQPHDYEPPVVAVVSGGNIDPLLMMQVLRHGLQAAGRFLTFWVRVADRPGSLAALVAVLAETDANVLEVAHNRTGQQLGVDEVEIGVQLETKGPDHAAEVLQHLRDAGFPARLR